MILICFVRGVTGSFKLKCEGYLEGYLFFTWFGCSETSMTPIRAQLVQLNVQMTSVLARIKIQMVTFSVNPSAFNPIPKQVACRSPN